MHILIFFSRRNFLVLHNFSSSTRLSTKNDIVLFFEVSEADVEKLLVRRLRLCAHGRNCIVSILCIGLRLSYLGLYVIVTSIGTVHLSVGHILSLGCRFGSYQLVIDGNRTLQVVSSFVRLRVRSLMFGCVGQDVGFQD